MNPNHELDLREAIRNAAAADIFSQMATPEGVTALRAKGAALPDAALDAMGVACGLLPAQLPDYRAMMKGESNPFVDEMARVADLLGTGDIILMSGRSRRSKALVSTQKYLFYGAAKSSHVALVHAGFLCIDAMPKVGTSHRLISEVLDQCEDDWRVVRFKNLTDGHRDRLLRAGIYYLAQPYSIQPSTSNLTNFSYCSELARKVFDHADIGGTGIVTSPIVAPAHFDELADSHSEWSDVTTLVKPAVDFCRNFPEWARMSCKLMVDGLKLNRARYEERAALLEKIPALVKKGRMSKEKGQEYTRAIMAIDARMTNRFWDRGATQ